MNEDKLKQLLGLIISDLGILHARKMGLTGMLEEVFKKEVIKPKPLKTISIEEPKPKTKKKVIKK